MVKVDSESAVGDELFQIMVGSGDQPEIDGPFGRFAQATDLSIFENVQKLGLKQPGGVAISLRYNVPPSATSIRRFCRGRRW